MLIYYEKQHTYLYSEQYSTIVLVAVTVVMSFEQLPVKEFVSATLFSPAQVLLEQNLLPHKARRHLNRISLLY